MNVENNGQHVNDDDDVNLTAYALGEINDPKLKSRLERLLKEDENKRADYEATLQLAAMIRESVDDDLPLAPGSLHQVVLAELDDSPSKSADGRSVDGVSDGNAGDPIAKALDSEIASDGKSISRSSKSGSSPRTTYSYRIQSIALTLCLMVVCTFAIWRPWESKVGERVNLALGVPGTSAETNQDQETAEDESGAFNSGAREDASSAVGLDAKKAGRAGSLENNLSDLKKPDSDDRIDSFDIQQFSFDESAAGQSSGEGLGRRIGGELVPQVRKSQSVASEGASGKNPFPESSSTSPAPSGKPIDNAAASSSSFSDSIMKRSVMPNAKAPASKMPAKDSSIENLGRGNSLSNAEKIDGKQTYAGGGAERNKQISGNQKAANESSSFGGGGVRGGGLGGGGGGLGGGRGLKSGEENAKEENPGQKIVGGSMSVPKGGLNKDTNEMNRRGRKPVENASSKPTSRVGKNGPQSAAGVNPEKENLKLPKSTKPNANSTNSNFGLGKNPVDGRSRGGRNFGASKSGGMKSELDDSEKFGQTRSKEGSVEKKNEGKLLELRNLQFLDRKEKRDEKKILEVDPTREAKKKTSSNENLEKKLKPLSGRPSPNELEFGREAHDVPEKTQQMPGGRRAELKVEAKAASQTKTASPKSNEAPAADREGESILEELERAQKELEKEESERNSDEHVGEIHENDFVKPLGTNALSTFSIDTDTASYTNLRQKLQNNVQPSPADVRIEEMLNYFDYSYPQPKENDPFSVSMEVASCPWKPGNKLLKIGLKAREIANEERPPSNLVFLVDVSGSMRNEKKLPLLQQGLNSLVDQLREDDYVSIVTYSDTIQNPLEPTDGSQKAEIKKVINGLTAGGSTNGSGGLEESYRLAEKHFLKGGTNRIVMGTDGDFNFGISDDDELVEFIKTKTEQSKVFLTVCGFGVDSFKDQKVQKMAQNGNGKVFYIDSAKEAERVFVEKVSGGLVTAAKDVKLQLLFNPRTVKEYRLIGYENRMLQAQDFDDDQKDAGEMDAGDRVTALYEFVPADSNFTFPVVTETHSEDLKYQRKEEEKYSLTKIASSNEIATLRVRFKQPESDKSDKREFPVENNSTSFNGASKDFQFASSVAGLGLLLRKSKHRGTLNFEGLEEFAAGALNDEKDESRKEILDLIRRAKTLFK